MILLNFAHPLTSEQIQQLDLHQVREKEEKDIKCF